MIVLSLRTFLFGPVGNSKMVFFFIHLLYIAYEYPLYFFVVIPQIWPEHKLVNVLFILNSVIMWYSLYTVYLMDPGYLKQDTYEYQTYLKKVTLVFFSFRLH